MAATALCIIIPILVSFLLMSNRNKRIISQPGTIVWAYVLGICFAVCMHVCPGIFAEGSTDTLEIMAYVSVAIGLPLILFSANIRDLKFVSQNVKKAFLLLILSVALVTAAVYMIYARKIENGNILSGMALAIYTGGTPNLNAVAYTFGLDSKTILTANLSDVIIGGVFYLFIIFLSKLIGKDHAANKEDIEPAKTADRHSSKKEAFRNLLLSVLLVFISAGLGLLLWAATGKKDGRLTDYLVPLMMIGTSIGGILLSGNSKINSVSENDTLGKFFITLFSFSIASLLDINSLRNINRGVFIMLLSITVASFFVHMLLCRLSKIDLKTMIVTSTAGIYGPAFIPGVCSALNADHLAPAGLIVGSFGYAIGTFLGCGLVLLL